MSYQGVVTPEAVVLEFDGAGIGSRIAASAIDIAIRTAAAIVFSIAAGVFVSATSGPVWVGVTVITLAGFLLTIGYSVFFEAFWGGRTPGKAALGLRVVTTEGSPIAFRHAAIRGLVGLVEIFMTYGLVAVVAISLSKRNQRLGDMLAGTLVLRERKAAAVPQAVQFTPPPQAIDYMAVLDVSGLREADYVTIRSFLVRTSTLRGQARVALAEQIGRQMAIRLHATPPEWMSAEMFLLCVASAYQQRFASF